MYNKYNIDGIVAVSPLSLSGELKDIILDQLSKDYEGIMDKDIGLILCVTDVLEHSDGEIIAGDSNVFFKVKFSVVSFMPKLHEIIRGKVSQATDFGAFINIGPFEGLCHVSQVMPDFNSYNPELPGFSAKDSNKILVVEDKVLTRIANISFKKTIADTKIGLTMRQDGLGKEEWLLMDSKSTKKKTSKRNISSKESTRKKGGKK
ncbi:MAG: DNA-directed RNA polymerase [Candidatus ainarchaeum sp.]|nr:DNA-directed RNA polymerase [Candidatus ainarchaeum sp.]MDD3975791.1 DNA-directed RNA polymerase [Candidatus ainarchaeum sp.]